MKLFQIFKNTLIILSVAPFFSLVNLYGAPNLVAHGGGEHHSQHHQEHPHHDAARHDLNHRGGELNHGGERRAFNRGVEAGAVEGAGFGGAGAVDVDGDGDGWNQPIYNTPNPSAQPNVQYIQVETPSATPSK